jgi:hypothetical protein
MSSDQSKLWLKGGRWLGVTVRIVVASVVAFVCLLGTRLDAETIKSAERGSGQTLRAIGHDSHIDVTWEHPRSMFINSYHVYRAEQAHGPFVRLNKAPLTVPVISDFVGQPDLSRWYRVDGLGRDGRTVETLGLVRGQTRAGTTEQFLNSVQVATFRYFWDFAHPRSGLIRERSNEKLEVCATGGTGFGLMAIMIGVERGFISRQDAVERINLILHFLEHRAQRYHGAFAHWINGSTGETIPFSAYDDGGDIVETSFLMQGILTVRQYFNKLEASEQTLRERATRLWEGVEWDWYLRTPDSKTLYWHWSPKHGWAMNLPVGGGFNETMITYILAMASPTHAIPTECYYRGWVGEGATYVNGTDYYGFTQWVGDAHGGPLFFTHYSFIGLDPRGLRDRYCDYFENNRNISLINRSYCIENPGGFPGYGQHMWGLTASDGPRGYRVHAPGLDNGTIAPTAAISAIPYVPEESLAAMRHFYHIHGHRLWGNYGFKDAFNVQQNWYADSYLAIDQGPIICMIENYRTGLCWEWFMRNQDVRLSINKVMPGEPLPTPLVERANGQHTPVAFTPATPSIK